MVCLQLVVMMCLYGAGEVGVSGVHAAGSVISYTTTTSDLTTDLTPASTDLRDSGKLRVEHNNNVTCSSVKQLFDTMWGVMMMNRLFMMSLTWSIWNHIQFEELYSALLQHTDQRKHFKEILALDQNWFIFSWIVVPWIMLSTMKMKASYGSASERAILLVVQNIQYSYSSSMLDMH